MDYPLPLRPRLQSSSGGSVAPRLKRRHPVFRSPSFTLRFLSDAGARRDDRIDPLVVYGISNGLVLSTATRGWHDCYYISNPFTKQWSALPKSPRIHKWVSLGFIVEPTDGSFRVVRIGGYPGSSNVVKFEIFFSKTCQWKDKTATFNLLVCLFQTPEMSNYYHAVACKKILHWMEYNVRIIAYDTSQTDDTGNDEMIQCCLINLPGDRVIDDKVTAGVIGVCQDHLHYCHCRAAANVTQNPILSVWKLRNYNFEGEGDWVLLYRIRLKELNLSLSEFVAPVAFHPLDPDTVHLHCISKMLLASLNLRTRVCSNHIRLKSVVNWWMVFAFVLPPWPTPIPQIT